jgi:hypothetical protein
VLHPPFTDTSEGNELDLWWQDHVGTSDFKWMAEYGNVWRIGGCFGVSYPNVLPPFLRTDLLQEDVLMVADPKALQHIMSGYHYPKKADFRQTIRLLTGTGLLYAEGPLVSIPHNQCYHILSMNCRSRSSPSEKDHGACVRSRPAPFFLSHLPCKGHQGISGEFNI